MYSQQARHPEKHCSKRKTAAVPAAGASSGCDMYLCMGASFSHTMKSFFLPMGLGRGPPESVPADAAEEEESSDGTEEDDKDGEPPPPSTSFFSRRRM